jgi:hypothetical protein
MNRLFVCFFVIQACCYAQAPPPASQTGESKAQNQPCVVVARHVPKFGENMSRLHPHRPFDFVEGNYPPGFKWRSELSDGDVRELQQDGGKIVVLKPDYQTSDVEDARKQCQSQATK